jgi:hypothetical protein
MYAAGQASTPVLNDVLGAAQATAMAMLAGWLGDRALDIGLRIPGIGPLAGLAGAWVGSSLWAWGGWDTGPSLGGFAVLPAIAGTFAVCALLKLVSVGMAGPRW